MDGVRWAFRCGKWKPTREQWTLVAQCVQPEEKQRIGRFVFQKDAKSAMVRNINKFVVNNFCLGGSSFDYFIPY